MTSHLKFIERPTARLCLFISATDIFIHISKNGVGQWSVRDELCLS